MQADVAGWATHRVRFASGRVTAAHALVAMLRAVGVRDVFGIVGGGIAPFSEAVLHSDLSLWHTRHEAGAAFCATEASFAARRPAAVFTTTGPGLTNAITGLMAARWDGAHVVLVSGGTPASQRGRFCVQETSPFTTPADLFTAGALFDYATIVTDVAELPTVARRLALGVARHQGFVAHVNVPLDIQSVLVDASGYTAPTYVSATAPREALEHCVARLRDGRAPIWIGHGARHAGEAIAALAERTGAPMICSPRAKGSVPEDHPLMLGVTGVGGHAAVAQYFERERPAHVLVLGSRLGEVTSCFSPAMIPQTAFLQVDVDPDAFGAGYPDVPVYAVESEVGCFVSALLVELGPLAVAREHAPRRSTPAPMLPRDQGRVRPQFLMQACQAVVVEQSDAVVMTESGNAFGWGNHHLRFPGPGRYRTSAAFGAMGHFVTGVVGAALARRGKAVAIVGDGAMLMNNEVSTAVKYGADAVWIVLNDGRYGITHHAMIAQGFEPVETLLPATDFVAFARSMGGDGVRVSSESEVVAALERALAHRGPYVVDVQIDATEVTPVLAGRVASLDRQRSLGSEEDRS